MSSETDTKAEELFEAKNKQSTAQTNIILNSVAAIVCIAPIALAGIFLYSAATYEAPTNSPSEIILNDTAAQNIRVECHNQQVPSSALSQYDHKKYNGCIDKETKAAQQTKFKDNANTPRTLSLAALFAAIAGGLMTIGVIKVLKQETKLYKTAKQNVTNIQAEMFKPPEA